MKVYVLEQWSIGFTEVVGVFTTKALAMSRAETRSGQRVAWEAHNAHGLCWVSTGRTSWAIVEFELEGLADIAQDIPPTPLAGRRAND